MHRGIWVAVVVGMILAGGVAGWYAWKRPHPVERDVADPSDAANDLMEDVVRWEDEGGAVVSE